MHRNGLMFNRVQRLFFLGLCALFCLISCSTWGKPKNDKAGLYESVKTFNDAIRWEDYRVASTFMPPSAKDTYWEQVDELQKNVRIMEFEVREITVEPEKLRGEAYVRCQYFHTNNPKLLTRNLKQSWRYSEEDKAWSVEYHDLDQILSKP